MARLNYKNLYYFRYRPKGAEDGSLHEYDRSPLVIFLDVQGKHALGVNLHWIPKSERLAFVKIVWDMADKIGTGTRKKIVPRLLYKTVKHNPRLAKIALNAIRSYIIPRISGMKVIPPEHWNKVLGNPRFRDRKVKSGGTGYNK